MISVVLAGASALPLNPRGFGTSRWQLYNEVYHFDRNWKGRRFFAFEPKWKRSPIQGYLIRPLQCRPPVVPANPLAAAVAARDVWLARRHTVRTQPASARRSTAIPASAVRRTASVALGC
jgi:hypothetical protein